MFAIAMIIQFCCERMLKSCFIMDKYEFLSFEVSRSREIIFCLKFLCSPRRLREKHILNGSYRQNLFLNKSSCLIVTWGIEGPKLLFSRGKKNGEVGSSEIKVLYGENSVAVRFG